VNTTALVFIVVALSCSVVDWMAVARQIKPLEYICKPLAAIGFVATAIALDPADDTVRVWLVIALVFCVAGDVFLMLPRDAFVPGLASFAVAQVLFTVSFAVSGTTTLRLVIGLVIVASGSALLARRFIGALRRTQQSALIAPIVIYMMVISAMVIGAIAGGSALAITGAILFLISDSLIAEERFVEQRRWQPMTIIVTYHLALAGLVLGLV
jgi:uncharacterized membrane protein YhhN